MDDTELMVSIRCTTYNHEPYIRQCLEGFVMQKTNFRFEAIVHDDASTDGTAAIVREYAEKYPDIIKPIYETENQYSKHDGSLRKIMDQHMKGKYVAICEGDDYWTDPLKLQKQVDFMEEHPEYGMCYTQCRYFYHKQNQFAKKAWGGPGETFTDFMERNYVPTLTAVFRIDLYKKYESEIIPGSKNWLMGDYPMWIWFSHESKIKFMEIETGIYRYLSSSACCRDDFDKLVKFKQSSLEINKFFNGYFNYYKDDLMYEKSFLLGKMKAAALFKKKKLYLKYWLQLIKKYPWYGMTNYKCYAYLVLFVSKSIRIKHS